MKTNSQHQKQATTTDQRNRHLDEHETEIEKQKLQEDQSPGKQEALRKHPKDSESH
jgi:hypothetical protein